MELNKRNSSIDLLRFIALFMIVIYHSYEYKATFLGVLVFFVLSGFLITESIERKNYSYLEYLKRRFYKIYPSLLATLFVSQVAYLIINRYLPIKLVKSAVAAILGYSNLYLINNNISYFESGAFYLMFKHLWALAIEIQFYIVFPLLIYASNKLFQDKAKQKKFKIILLSSLALASCLIMAYKFKNNVSITNIYYGTDTRLFSLFIGSLFYYLPYQNYIRSQKISTLMLSLCFGIFMISSVSFSYDSSFNYLGGMFFLSIFLGILLVELIKIDFAVEKYKFLKVFLIVGKHSYPYYLLQYPVMLITRDVFKWSTLNYNVIIFIHLIILIILSEIFYYLFEKGNTMYFRKSIALLTLLTVTVYASPIEDKTEDELLENLIEQSNVETVEEEKNTIVNVEKIEENNENQEINIIEPEPKSEHSQEDVQLMPSKKTTDADKKIKEVKKNVEEKIIPATNKRISFIGDSVMKMAEPTLKKTFTGSNVDAKVSRQFIVLPKLLKEMKENKSLNEVVVIHLGTNGLITKEAFDEAMLILDGRPVYFMNCVVPKSWEQSVNKKLESWAKEYTNANIINWYANAKGNRTLFYKDATHLTKNGVKQYIDLINKNIKL